VTADENDIGVRLGDARRDRADTDFADELDADRAFSFEFLRSWMSSARSSIE